MKMIFNYHPNKTHFHNKGFALSLVLKVRFFLELGNGLFNHHRICTWSTGVGGRGGVGGTESGFGFGDFGMLGVPLKNPGYFPVGVGRGGRATPFSLKFCIIFIEVSAKYNVSI